MSWEGTTVSLLWATTADGAGAAALALACLTKDWCQERQLLWGYKADTNPAWLHLAVPGKGGLSGLNQGKFMLSFQLAIVDALLGNRVACDKRKQLMRTEEGKKRSAELEIVPYIKG